MCIEVCSFWNLSANGARTMIRIAKSIHLSSRAHTLYMFPMWIARGTNLELGRSRASPLSIPGLSLCCPFLNSKIGQYILLLHQVNSLRDLRASEPRRIFKVQMALQESDRAYSFTL